MPENRDREKIAKHILPTASNLLGLCFVLLSFIKLTSMTDKTIIDEALGLEIIFFLASCIFSYASMRSERRQETFEKIADIFFLIGLAGLAFISLVVVLNLT